MRAFANVFRVAGILLLQCLLTQVVQAQAVKETIDQYPSKPIRLIVPFAPGSTTDTLSRLVGQRLSKTFGASIIADNRTGAGGVIAAEAVARAAPDGYTLLTGGTAILAIIPALAQKVSFDTAK